MVPKIQIMLKGFYLKLIGDKVMFIYFAYKFIDPQTCIQRILQLTKIVKFTHNRKVQSLKV